MYSDVILFGYEKNILLEKSKTYKLTGHYECMLLYKVFNFYRSDRLILRCLLDNTRCNYADGLLCLV